MKIQITLPLLSGLLVLFLAQPPSPAANGDCEGTATTAALTCTPVDCPEGCVKATSESSLGTIEFCLCNYVGPPPFCCKVARVLSTGGISRWGECDAPGCPIYTGRRCGARPEDDGWKAYCYTYYPPPEDGDGDGDDDEEP